MALAALKALVVDDDDDLRWLSALSLTTSPSAQWTVLEAASGRAAIVLAGRELPDVILLDEQMPGLDGLATLARLRAAPATCGIPIIFLTAKALGHERERYLAAGAAGLIAKPYRPECLADEVLALLRAQPARAGAR